MWVLAAPGDGDGAARFDLYDESGAPLDVSFTSRAVAGENATILSVDAAARALEVETGQGEALRVQCEDAQVLWHDGQTLRELTFDSLRAGQAITIHIERVVTPGLALASAVQLQEPPQGMQAESVARLKSGDTVADVPLTGERRQFVEEVVMNARARSAAWEGKDVNGLDECIRIIMRNFDSGETREFYVYQAAEGKPVIQMGAQGLAVMMSEEEWSELSAWIEEEN